MHQTKQFEKKSDTKLRLVKDLFWLTILTSLFFGFFLGTRPLSVPDEGRYTELPRQMIVTDDYVTPRLNGVKYFEKPPLVMWLTTTSIKAFGINEWALRFWPAFFALLGSLATFLYARRFYGRNVGIASSVVLSSTFLYYAHSRILILDMPVSALIACSLFSFHGAVFEAQKVKKYILLMGFFIFAAGALLTKGLIGIALPGTIILIWAITHKKWAALKLAFNPVGIVLFFALTLPWHVLAHLRNPEFFDFYIIHEQILRFLTTAHSRVQPFWMFIPVVIFGFFPWISYFYRGCSQAFKLIRSGIDRHHTLSFLLIWSAFIFIFFSASNSKLIPYIVPIFPALSILIGRSVTKTWEENCVNNNVWPIRLFQLFSLLFAIALPTALYIRGQHLNMNIMPYAALTTIALVSGIILSFIFQKKGNMRAVLVIIFCTATGMFLPLNKAWVHIEGRSIFPLTQKLNKILEAQDDIISWHTYYQDLPPYTGRRITVVEGFNELHFGTTVEDVSEWMITDAQFEKRLKSKKIYYLILRKWSLEDLYKHYPSLNGLHLFAQSDKDIILTNKVFDF